MRCPLCGQNDTRVVDSRLAAEDAQVRRRRACTACNGRFTTFEAAELKLPRVVKSDGTPEPFDEAKLRNGMERALYKRPVSTEAIDAAIARIKRNLTAVSERDIATRAVGTLVMAELRELDQVAYVRFASVYRAFDDVEDFRMELDRLQAEPSTAELAEHQIPLIANDG